MMGTKERSRLVVCDDDAILRGVIGRMATSCGFDLTGEGDSADTTLELVESTDAEVVVLDLALRSGSGEDVIKNLRDNRPKTCVVVFSAYVDDPMRLIDAGANVVIEKPDFERLDEVLRRLRGGLLADRDTRRPRPRVGPDLPPAPALSMSGLEPWMSFSDAADRVEVGDAVMAFDVLPPDGRVGHWDHVFLADYRLALARAVARTRRSQDRVSLSPSGLPVMLIVNGHDEAPSAIFSRIQEHWAREVDHGTPVAAIGRVSRGTVPSRLVADAVQLLLEGNLDPEHPLRAV